jgi:hypothetical protein
MWMAVDNSRFKLVLSAVTFTSSLLRKCKEIGLSVVDWIGLAQDRYSWESSCVLGNEPSGSIKCWETTEWLHNLWPLEWYSAPQS